MTTRGSGALRTAAWIFVIAASIRVLALVGTFHGNNTVDFFEDVVIAQNITKGNGYSLSWSYRNFLFYEIFLDENLRDPVASGHRITALKTPLYPALVSAVFACFGLDDFLALFLVHVVLSSLTCVLVFVAVKHYSPSAAAATAIAVALYPPFVYHAVASPESTVLILLFLAACLALTVRISMKPTTLGWAALGALGGLMALTDPVSLPFFGSLAGSLIFATWTCTSVAIRRIIILSIVLGIVILPWTIRNSMTFDRFVLLKTPAWQNLARGLHEAGIRFPKDVLVDLEKKGRSLNEAEEDYALRQLVWEVLSKDPMSVLRAIPRNFVHYWWGTERYRSDTSWKYRLGREFPYMGLLLVGTLTICWAFILLVRRPVTYVRQAIVESACVLLIVTYSAIFAVFGAWNLRYHFPVELGMIVLIGCFAAKRLRARKRSDPMFRQLCKPEQSLK
jgi:4-amino-4-deoxy-L-arabinose transferase-like glycosyltransferase